MNRQTDRQTRLNALLFCTLSYSFKLITLVSGVPNADINLKIEARKCTLFHKQAEVRGDYSLI